MLTHGIKSSCRHGGQHWSWLGQHQILVSQEMVNNLTLQYSIYRTSIKTQQQNSENCCLCLQYCILVQQQLLPLLVFVRFIVCPA